MKIYKLKETYPTSPSLGTIVNEKGTIGVYKNNNLVFDGSRKLKREEIKFLGDDRFWDIEDKSQFEVLEVQYMGSVYDRFDGCYYYEKGFDVLDDNTCRIHKEDISSGFVYIKSFRRKSDSKVFRIGDMVRLMYNNERKEGVNTRENFKEIEEIDLLGDEIRINGYVIDVNKLIKKKPSCTTFDGVSLYRGDIAYALNNDSFKFEKFEVGHGLTYLEGWTLFLNLSDVHKYILDNKPINLTFKEIMDLYGKYDFTKVLEKRIIKSCEFTSY